MATFYLAPRFGEMHERDARIGGMEADREKRWSEPGDRGYADWDNVILLQYKRSGRNCSAESVPSRAL